MEMCTQMRKQTQAEKKKNGLQWLTAHHSYVKHCTRERVSFSAAWREGSKFKENKVVPLKIQLCRPSLPRDARGWSNSKQPNILFCSGARMSKCVLKAVSGSPRRDGCVAAWGLVICLPLSRRMNTWDLMGGRTAPGYRQTATMYDKARMCTRDRKTTHLRSPRRHTDRKKCKYVDEKHLCTKAIFVLRPHAPRQFFSGDRVQSLQIDWSIFITGPGAQTDVFFFPPSS